MTDTRACDADSRLDMPFADAPGFGELKEVAAGVLWTRMPLPAAPHHVNCYLLRDEGGWAAIDTGIASAASREYWAAIAKALDGPVRRLIVTHHHLDHIGLAGWFADTFGAGLSTSATSYLSAQSLLLDPDLLRASEHVAFFKRHGGTTELVEAIGKRGERYRHALAPLPKTYRRLMAGDRMWIGGREFDVLAGEGHAPEQLMLHCRAERIFFAADQIIERISPNISVQCYEPEADPLGRYLGSMRALPLAIADEALVLSGHRRPFRGLHRRCAALIAEHEARCEELTAAVAARPMTVFELVSVLFDRPLSPLDLSLAFGETLAHVNYLVARGQLAWRTGSGGLLRVERAEPA